MRLRPYLHHISCSLSNTFTFSSSVERSSLRCAFLSQSRFVSDAPSDDTNQTDRESASLSSSATASQTAAHEACRPLYSDGQIGLRKASWLRMDPVSKWTILVDLARRGPYLLEGSNVERKKSNHFLFGAKDYFSNWKYCFHSSEVQREAHSKEKTPSDVLGQNDGQVRFTQTSIIHHTFICQALPYAARLQLALSLLLWLRCLRDVQDTLARLHTPFANTTRLRKSLLAHVFPTRWMEHWIDPLTCVSVKMNEKLNGTGEQVPAPHTWDPETAETVDDAVLELTLAVGGERAQHGKRTVNRAELLDRVQGLTRRLSDDDKHVVRLVGADSNRRQRRRQLLARKNRKQFSPSIVDPASGNGKSSSSTEQTRDQWVNTDSKHSLPPSSLDSSSLEDASYHANSERGEGCPFSDHGTLSSCPIHIPSHGSRVWEGCGATVNRDNAALEAEATLGRCVQAHAAILSSLFIEGRVVQFTTTDPVVYHYVLWLFEELIKSKYLFSELIQEKSESDSMQLMPYYPPWCFQSVLALVPPATERIKKSEAANLAGLILCAAPCDVLVETIPSIDTEGSSSHESLCRSEPRGASVISYITQVQEEVERQRRVLLKAASRKDQSHMSGLDEAKSWRVSWVPLRAHRPDYQNHIKASEKADANEAYNQTPNGSERPMTFVSKQKHIDAYVKNYPWDLQSHFYTFFTSCASTMLNYLTSVYQRWSSRGGDSERGKQQRRGEWFIEEVNSAVHNRVHALQLLCLPHNSMVSRCHLREWVWERLPCSLRLVGVNTSPWDALFFFPQAPFLSHKVGNAFRYRAVERVVVAKYAAAFGAGPLRSLAGRSLLLRGGKRWARAGLHSRLNSLDRARLSKFWNKKSRNVETCSGTSDEGEKIPMETNSDKAEDVLVTERAIDYLANPNKLTWLGLISAIIFRL